MITMNAVVLKLLGLGNSNLLNSAGPYIGELGRVEKVKEYKVEMI